jgi:pilus assembly protein TadC
VTRAGPAPVLVLLAVALLLWVPSGPGRRSRLKALVPPPDRDRRRRAGTPPGPVRRWAESGLAGLAGCLLLGGGVLGVLAGAGITVGAERLLRRSAAGAEQTADALRSDLPVVCDLLAVCLAAGTPTGAAVGAVAGAVPGPLGERLSEVAALYALGAAPRSAWAGAPSGSESLARVLIRAGESGSTVVPALHRLAADLRSTARAEVDAAVRRAGVWVLAPLGACFLPAFLCLGVAPLVLGIAADVFGAP